MHARLPWLVPAALLLLAVGCPKDPPPSNDESETDTGEPSCLDTDSPGPDIVINSNAAIAELELGECVPERILISGGAVTDLTGLDHLREVGILEIRFNPQLQALWGVHKLERIGTLIITGNGALPSLPEFGSLGQVDSITITGNSALTDLGSFPALSSVGKLEISNNPKLTDYSGFEALTSTTGTVELWDAALITDLSGLEALETIGGTFRVESMPVLESLAGIGVKNIGGDLRILNNPALSECVAADFAAAITVAGATVLNNNKSALCD